MFRWFESLIDVFPEPDARTPPRTVVRFYLFYLRPVWPLFAATLAEAPAAAKDALREALSQIDPDALAPREALDALYALKRLTADE